MRQNSTMHILNADVDPSVSRIQFNQMENKYFVRFLLKVFKHTKQMFWKSPYTTWIAESPALPQTTLEVSCKIWLVVANRFNY